MVKMTTREVEKKESIIAVFCCILLILLIFSPVSVTADNPTLVYVNPATRTVSAGQTFSISISCTPGQTIKSYELKLSFNPALLHANSVSEGTIFTGYTTFFNDGTINNVAGTITDIYGLIVGAGGVSSPGTLVNISFTAQAASGTTSIGLYDVGVTNNTAYVPITVTNGTVILREFTLTITLDGSGSVTKNPNQATYPYGTVVTLTATPSTGWVFSSWTGDLSGNTNPTTLTMTANKSVVAHFTANQYTLTITTTGSGTVTKNPNQATYAYGTVVTLTAIPSSGWMFNSWSGDLTGSQNPKTITMNGNKAVSAHFTDSMAPLMSGITRTNSSPLDTSPSYGWVNVSCTITDNVGVTQVVLRIHTPSGSWNNVSMTAGSSNKYYCRSTTAFSTAGNYTYTIWAKDAADNSNTSNSIVFSMPPNWDINLDGDCLIFDLVLISNRYGQTGANGWIREDVDNNGDIQVLDLVAVSNHYAETWWV